MDWKYLLTSFEGRIGRQQWWLGTIVLIVISLILFFVVMPLFGVSMMSGFEPAGGADAMAAMMRKMAIAQLVMLAIFAFPTTALMKKRLNDRDRPSWMVYLFWAPTVIGVILNLLGLGGSVTDVEGVAVPTTSMLGMIVGLATLVIGIWALVELGIRKGTEGPNQYGPDPVAG